MKGKTFTAAELTQMQSIFKRIDPTTIESVQVYKKENEYRIGCTQVIYTKYREPICVFQVFEPLSKYRMSLLMRLSASIPYKIHIRHSREDRMTIGWKVE
jgi:hypothetical protein